MAPSSTCVTRSPCWWTALSVASARRASGPCTLGVRPHLANARPTANAPLVLRLTRRLSAHVRQYSLGLGPRHDHQAVVISDDQIPRRDHHIAHCHGYVELTGVRVQQTATHAGAECEDGKPER